MSLVKDSLAASLRPFFVPQTMPTGDVPSTVRQWAMAYAVYASTIMAGPAIIASPLSAVGFDGRFSNALDSSLRNMWVTATWIGPGIVGTTLFVPPLVPLLENIGRSLVRTRDPESALSVIVDTLHTYTLGITVTLTSPTGVSVSPVS